MLLRLGCVCLLDALSVGSAARSLDMYTLSTIVFAVDIFQSDIILVDASRIQASVRTLASSSALEHTTQHELLSTKSYESLAKPSLGAYGKGFTLKRYLARGGQAEVWTGQEDKTKRTVVFRFLLGLCEAGYAQCRVEELDAVDIQQSRAACALANQAHEKYIVATSQDEDTRQHSYYLAEEVANLTDHRYKTTQCLLPISPRATDIAFEVWSYAGDVTLAEGFFTHTSLGWLSMDDKRAVLRGLSDAVATLASDDVQSGSPCCCSEADMEYCTQQLRPARIRRLISGAACPLGYQERPGACGAAIVHHDIKFDNVMLQRDHSAGVVRPTLIDFGAATRCDTGRSVAFSRDWVPFWSDDPLSFPTTECWSYDTYGVGLLWLTTELLSTLSPTELLCNSLYGAGNLSGSSASAFRQGRCKFEDVLAHGQAVNILEPVEYLVHELHTKLLKAKHFENLEVFAAALASFINNASELEEHVRVLPFTLPPLNILEEIFEQLRECPRFPSFFLKAADRMADCRFRVTTRRLHEALFMTDPGLMVNRLNSFESACDEYANIELARITSKVPEVDAFILQESDLEILDTALDPCRDKEMQALYMMLIKDDVAGVEHFLNHSEISRSVIEERFLPDGETLLSAAARAQSAPIVKLFLEHGADPLQVSKPLQGDISAALPPLLAAASVTGNVDVLKLLIDHSRPVLADPNLHSTNFMGPTLLSLIAEHGDRDMLALALQTIEGIVSDSVHPILGSINGTKKLGAPGSYDVPLLKAAAAGKTVACRMLLEARADPHVVDNKLRTPLLLAVYSRNAPTALVLAEAAPDALKRSAPGLGTPLHVATSNGDNVMVQTLISLGADETTRAFLRSEVPLHEACRSGDVVSVAKTLARNPAAQRVRNAEQETPLLLAARKCASPRVLQAIMDAAPEDVLHMELPSGYTPLMVAAAWGRVPCLRVLASRLPIDSVSSLGMTALMVAAMHEQALAVQALVGELGADPFAKDKLGRPVGMFIGLRAHPAAAVRHGVMQTMTALVEAASSHEVLAVEDASGMSTLGRWVLYGNLMGVTHMIDTIGLNCSAPVVRRRPTFEWRQYGVFVDSMTPLALVRQRLKDCSPYIHQQRNVLHFTNQYEPCSAIIQYFDGSLQVQSFLENNKCDPLETDHYSRSREASLHAKIIFALHK